MLGGLLDNFRPGETIYLPGATGEILALANCLARDPERMRGVHVVGCFLPGMNEVDYAGLDDSGTVTTFLLPQVMRKSFEAKRIRLLPLPYSGISRYLAKDIRIDVAFAHVGLPGADGGCSLGIAADFTSIAWRAARRRILIINPMMPDMKRGARLPLADADEVFELSSPLVSVPDESPLAVFDDIARLAKTLVPDGAAIQVGIGRAPAALWPHLEAHRDLRILSGLVSDGVRRLSEAGALAAAGQHRTGVAAGSEAFYRYLAECDLVCFETAEKTHDVAALSAVPRFTAINSALEIDLLGQVNLEWRDGKISSGVGGAPDFARAAALAPEGLSIVLMPATAARGARSRIVPTLPTPSVSMARSDIDAVVTEFGIARLRCRSMDERAHSLCEIAAPQFRSDLRQQWKTVRTAI